MDEDRWRIIPSFLNTCPSFMTNCTLLSASMSSSGLPGTAIVGEVPGLERSARLLRLADFVAVDRHRAKDVGRRNPGVLPRLEELQADLAACLASDIVIGVGGKGQRYLFGVRVLEAGDG